MKFMQVFIPWNKPALPAAAEYLVNRYRSGQVVDLSRVFIAVPVRRAGRRLLELLAERAEKDSLLLTPPDILTESKLPERLYTPKRPFADDLTQFLAWSNALRNTPPAQLKHVLPHPPPEGDTLAWLELGAMLSRVHRELAADGRDFRDVVRCGSELPGFVEEERWRTLCHVQTAYLRLLDDLQLWDVQTARLVAIAQRECRIDQDIVLLGLVDPNRALRQMLEQVAARVTVLVHAPHELADHFDEQGCLCVEKWLDRELPIDDDQLVRVDGPEEQAEATAAWLSSLGGKYRTDEVVVGVNDRLLVPQLQRELAEAGIVSRWVEGVRLAESAPLRLLETLTAYVDRQRFCDLAALVRHCDVHEWLDALPDCPQTGSDLLTLLDEYYGEAYPARLDVRRLQFEIDAEAASERQQRCRQRAAHLLWVVQKFERLTEPLARPRQSLGAWSMAFRAVLTQIYGDRPLRREVPHEYFLRSVLKKIGDSLAALSEVPSSLAGEATLSEAAEMLLRPLAKESIPPPADARAIELLGWLELALDDAPALVVTTFNEGFVPEAAPADAFLTNNLRRELGLLHNDRRYARDAYALSVLLASRERLQLIVGRRDPEGNPLCPSRLLFAAPGEKVAERALRFFGPLPPTPPRRNLLGGLSEPPVRSAITIPQPTKRLPVEAELPQQLSVSQFKAYLACPYRFYLAHVLKLCSVADSAAELDGAAFGDLIHDCLQHFGRADERISTDPDRILAFLSDRLDRLAAARFGSRSSRAAIRVQVEQARVRFREFARWQAERTNQGWQIAYSEDFDQQLTQTVKVDGKPFQIRGRIDRIDYHPETQQLCVLDYKTGDTPQLPDKAHRKGDEWIDLQLPLYRHLLPSLKLESRYPCDAPVQLGYINLPKDLGEIGARLADWSERELAEADNVAWGVVRGVRAQCFWPKKGPPKFPDDFTAICQDSVLDPWTDREDQA